MNSLREKKTFKELLKFSIKDFKSFIFLVVFEDVLSTVYPFINVILMR